MGLYPAHAFFFHWLLRDPARELFLAGSPSPVSLLSKLTLLAAVLINGRFVLGGSARKLMAALSTIHYKVQVIGVSRMKHRFQ